MVLILGIAAFVVWLYGLNVRPGDERVHLLVRQGRCAGPGVSGLSAPPRAVPTVGPSRRLHAVPTEFLMSNKTNKRNIIKLSKRLIISSKKLNTKNLKSLILAKI